jgi:ubiquitin conjugation factor E4 B
MADVANTVGISLQFSKSFGIIRPTAKRLTLKQSKPLILTVDSHLIPLLYRKLEKFVRFANLLMNDATYLLDESLSKLAEIHTIQLEMKNKAAWEAQPANQRKERERLLRTLEGQATSYTTLGKTTVALLKEFTAETKGPFMTPEIVDRLAAMLNYNLDALVGPRCQDLVVENADKYRFNPKQLLSDILQIYLNLSDQPEFIRAIAGEGRSYKKELFEAAAGIARRKSVKSETEIEQLGFFVEQVEVMKTTMEAEEDLGEIPDEFLGLLSATRLHMMMLTIAT